jgi:hypothetical protein
LGEYLVKNVPTDRLVEIVRIAMVSEITEHASLIESLFGRIKKCRQDRNRILHWLHESTNKPDVVRFIDKRAGRDRNPKDYTAADIQAIAAITDAACDEIVEWWNLYNWHREVRLHGTRAQLAHPPHWALPKILRSQDKPPPRGRQPRKRQG